jgi:hypothetical protein
MTDPKKYEELKEIVTLGVSIGNGFGKAVADGDWSWSDLLHFGPVIKNLGPAVDGFSKGIAGLKEGLTDGQYLDLQLHIKSKFDIMDDKVEVVIEEAIQVLASAWKIYNTCREK